MYVSLEILRGGEGRWGLFVCFDNKYLCLFLQMEHTKLKCLLEHSKDCKHTIPLLYQICSS